LFNGHPKRERDREVHLNYYASAYNRGRQLSHRKTKTKPNARKHQKNLNYLNYTIQITQNKHNKLNPGSVDSYDLWPGNGVGLL